jgi:hypothetical protein
MRAAYPSETAAKKAKNAPGGQSPKKKKKFWTFITPGP